MTTTLLAAPWLSAQLPALVACPTVFRRYTEALDSLWRQPHVPGEALELCRLRLAGLHGAAALCDIAPWSQPPAGAVAATLAGRWYRPGEVDAVAAVCLELAEVYYQDPSAIDDALADRVIATVGEPGYVVLIEALGVFDGLARLERLKTVLDSVEVAV